MSNVIKLDDFVVNPDLIVDWNSIEIQRFKNDPGAFYVRIRTTGGVLGILRYAYEGAAYENIEDDADVDEFTLKIGYDKVKFVLGNFKHDDEVEHGTKAFLDVFCDAIETCNQKLTIHTADGFPILIYNRPTRSGWSHSSKGKRCKQPEEDEYYGAETLIQCIDIRKSDEAAQAVISAVGIWCNRVNVNYTMSYNEQFDLSYIHNASTAQAIFTNPGIMKLYASMNSMSMNEEAKTSACKLIARAIEKKSNSLNGPSVYGLSYRVGEF